VYPGGNGRTDSLAVYLAVAEDDQAAFGLQRTAAFKLILQSPLEGAPELAKEAQHTFTSRETDWGGCPPAESAAVAAAGAGAAAALWGACAASAVGGPKACGWVAEQDCRLTPHQLLLVLLLQASPLSCRWLSCGTLPGGC
jgi:hypothetical protein